MKVICRPLSKTVKAASIAFRVNLLRVEKMEVVVVEMDW